MLVFHVKAVLFVVFEKKKNGSQAAALQAHDWVVYRLGGILGSVGRRVKIHKITPTTGKERGDPEIKDYVVLQKPQGLTDRLLPP
jgi:hypothetical protein